MTTQETPHELKRALRPIDLAYLAGKKRQSSRTGFVHLFHGNDAATDTIPIYENICFAYALLAQKKAESVLEAKDLLQRLFAFQNEAGNFPIYLHDFPRAYDFYLGLKIAPLLLRCRLFHAVLGAEFTELIDVVLQRIFFHYEEKRLAPLWQFRKDVCSGSAGSKPSTEGFSAADWWEYWISLQFLETPVCDFYHANLQMAMGFDIQQNGYEPAPRLIDWVCAEKFSPRLIKDHPHQIQLAALERVETIGALDSDEYSETGKFFWKDTSLHSLIFIGEAISEEVVKLPSTFELGRDDLFEVAFFCDASPEIDIAIDGKKGTLFSLGQTVCIKSPSREIFLTFELADGEGEFCGHIFRSNRPGQIACAGPLQYEAFDWKIGLRTLRRSPDCAVRIHRQVIWI